MNRQKLIHLHGVNAPKNASVLTDKGFVKGEIAVKTADVATESELYVLGGDEKLAVFATADALKAYTDAKIKDATDGLNDGAIAEITNNITAISGDVKTLSGTVTTNYTELDGRLDSVEGILGTPAEGETAATGLVKKVDDIDAAYKAADNAIDERLDALEAIDHDHANKTELDLIEKGDVAKWNAAEQNAKNYAAEEIAKETSARTDAVKEVSDALAEEVSARTQAVTTLENKIIAAQKAATTAIAEGTDAGNNLSIASATSSDGAVTYTINLSDVASAQELNSVKNNLATVSSKTDTLIGDDANKSVRTIANEELAAVLVNGADNGAEDNFKTLKEIADWIEKHPEDAAAMNSAIQANASAITTETATRISEDNGIKQSIATLEDKLTGATQNEIDAVEGRITILENTVGDDTKGLVKGVADNTAAIAQEVTDRTTAISDVETAYKEADTKLSEKITSAETKFATAIESVRTDFAKDIDDALASAKTYTDTALTSAKTYTDTAILTLTNDKIKKVEDNLAEVKATADSAIQTVTVLGQSEGFTAHGIVANKKGVDVEFNFNNMVIDCGSWE